MQFGWISRIIYNILFVECKLICRVDLLLAFIVRILLYFRRKLAKNGKISEKCFEQKITVTKIIATIIHPIWFPTSY